MPAEGRQDPALTLIKHQGHQRGRKPLEIDCIGFVALRAVLKKHVSAQRGFGLLTCTKDAFGQAQWKENSSQICIEFPFILHKRRTIARGAAHKQPEAENMTQQSHSVFGDQAPQIQPKKIIFSSHLNSFPKYVSMPWRQHSLINETPVCLINGNCVLGKECPITM